MRRGDREAAASGDAAVLQLTARDHAVLGAIGAVGLAPVAQVARTYYPSLRACRRRLGVLAARGLVRRVQVDASSSGLPRSRGGAIVALTPAGVGVVRALGGVTRPESPATWMPLAASVLAAAEVGLASPGGWTVDGLLPWAWAEVDGGTPSCRLALALDPPLLSRQGVSSRVRTMAAWVAAAPPGEARHVAYVAGSAARRAVLAAIPAVASGESAGWLHTAQHPAAVARALFL